MKFTKQGKSITLQGIREPDLQLSSMSATQLYNASKGNDIWTFAVVHQEAHKADHITQKQQAHPEALHHLLALYKDIFTNP